MTKNKFLIPFFIIFSIAISQTINKSGIGFEFHSFPLSVVNMDGNATGNGMGIYLPIKTKTFLFEPYFYHERSKTIVTYESYENSDSSYKWKILAGMFFVKNQTKSTAYVGVRVGTQWEVEETSYISGGEETIEREEEDAFIFAPTIGFEYYVGHSLSFGGETMYYSVTDEEENDGIKTRTTSASVSPRFIIRFYF